MRRITRRACWRPFVTSLADMPLRKRRANHQGDQLKESNADDSNVVFIHMVTKDNGLPTSIVIFGASGDLAQRKLIPSLFNLYCKDRLPKTFRIVGYGGTAFTEDEFRTHLKEGMEKFSDAKYTDKEWAEFA